MSNDRMTAEEIRTMYRDAKNKKKQLLILAELNLCKPADIRAIINGETDELPPMKKKAVPRKSPSRFQVTDEEKARILELHQQGKTPAEIAEKIADKPLPEEPASVGVVEIAGALLDYITRDLRDHIVEIKYSKDGYTVRVEGETEGAVLTRRHKND